jgi:amino acid transporter
MAHESARNRRSRPIDADFAARQPAVMAERGRVSTIQAAFIGVAAMVGAGIFSLLGTTAEVAGAAVWVSFLLAGGIAALQGYSFAKMGSRWPSAGGLLEYISAGYGEGHIATVTAWLLYFANGIVTAMVALSFGSYASTALPAHDLLTEKGFAIALVVVMAILNLAGSTLVARVQSAVVVVVVGILGIFSVTTIANMDPALLAPSNYPSLQHIVSGVALTFFAFLGFGVVTFTAKDLGDPKRQLPRAMAIAIGLATIVYLGVSLGVFGTLTVPEVIAAGPTAIAVAAQPVLGNLGYTLMGITALFATAGATNAGLYPMADLADNLVQKGQFPRVMSARVAGAVPMGLLVVAIGIIVLVALFDLSAIASIGSAVALTIFLMVTIGHLRVFRETGARLSLLLVALLTTGVTLATFVFTTLIQEPISILTLAGLLVASVVLDVAFARPRLSDKQPAGSG